MTMIPIRLSQDWWRKFWKKLGKMMKRTRLAVAKNYVYDNDLLMLYMIQEH